MTDDVIHCPRCDSAMETIEDPDFSYEECPECSGVFLDEGEMNAFATGRSGNIEFSTLHDQEKGERFTRRVCPKCEDQNMEKMALLGYSDIILDVCRSCRGFFFDPDELHLMNEELRELTPPFYPQEYRKKHGDFLVRLDKLREVFAITQLGFNRAVEGYHMEASVYFPSTLDLELKIHETALMDQLLQGMGLSTKQDIKTGDRDFDSQFIIQGKQPDEVRSFLTDERRERLLDFADDKPVFVSEEGELEVNDERVILREGPYRVDNNYNMEEDPNRVRKRLFELAEVLYPGSSE